MLFIHHSNFNKMTQKTFVLCLACLFVGEIFGMDDWKQHKTKHQKREFISARVGDSLTLKCNFSSDATKHVWYQQKPGRKPKLVSGAYINEKAAELSKEFRNDPRFTAENRDREFHLKISNIQLSDTATYFCASGVSSLLEFNEGVTVGVQSSSLNFKALVHQSQSETIQPDNSVTLNCTVDAGSCDGDVSVYWFKHSEDSPQLFTSGGRNDQCVRKPKSETKTCVYNLPMTKLNRSHAGTYYCAVASCGHVLFGNGTRLAFQEEMNALLWVYLLSGGLVFTIIMSSVLAFLLYKTMKRKNCQSPECQARRSAPSMTNTEGYQDEENLQYSAINVTMSKRSRNQRDNTPTECVYARVKL